LTLILVQWWAWKSTDGGGLLVQRMLACKNEKHAVYATLWFNIAHYALRSWPWILVALCSLLLLDPSEIPLDSKGNPLEERAYPVLINKLLPIGLKGLLISAFFAAFMSTADTHMNWGSSYFVNDFYKRFLQKNESEKHYILVSRIAGVFILAGAACVAFLVDRISDAFFFILQFTAGVGMVHLARWLWWRTNAWSELSCMIASLPVILLTGTVAEQLNIPASSILFKLLWMVVGTMAVWVPVTLLTKPVGLGQITEFYKRVRPYGFWGPVRRLNPRVKPVTQLHHDLGMWVLGVALIYSATLGIGWLLLGNFAWGIGLTLLSAGLLAFTIRQVRRAPDGLAE
jgi:Na+/proline symporter